MCFDSWLYNVNNAVPDILDLSKIVYPFDPKIVVVSLRTRRIFRAFSIGTTGKYVFFNLTVLFNEIA